MWLSVVSVGIAFVAAIGITWGVTTATRRSDRRRRARGEKLPNEGGALVTVRLRRWQWLVIRVLAVVLLVVGGLLGVVVIALAPEGAPPSMVVVAVVFVLAGTGGIVLASSMRRTRILAMEDHLLVRQGLREERRVDLREIATLAPLANQYGGVQGRSADGRRLFHVMGLARGYVEFDAYLRERVVHNSAPAPAAFAADTVPVPPWRGVSASADWTNIPLGHGGRPRPVIRLFVDGDVVVLHTSDVRALVDGRQAVAESDSQPLAFLASPALVDPTSLGGRQVAGLPPESLVLLRDAQEVPTAVLRDADARTFRKWVSGLPR